MITYQEISQKLHQAAQQCPKSKGTFFKSGKGEYGEHDKFIGVNVPTLRIFAKEYQQLPLDTVQLLLSSPINEERLLALFILVDRYKKKKSTEKEAIYQLYLSNLKHINNWNLVDSSAQHIMGAHLLDGDKQLLMTLAQSPIMWERRVAIVATQQFIRNHQFDWTIKIALLLLNDQHDLIHKATGWMLREVGQKDISILREFLDVHAHSMPRTMLRYSIEKLNEPKRKMYLGMKNNPEV